MDDPHPPGVWRGDAAPGQVAITVYSAAGVRLLRLEVDEQLYRDSWAEWLARWLAEVDPPPLFLVPR